MKRKILVFVITALILTSCGRAYRREMAEKALKDAEAREDLTEEVPGIVEVLEDLDFKLNEMELVLQGEESSYTDDFEAAERKIADMENQLLRLEADLKTQAENLEDIRETLIEPSLEKAREKNSLSDVPASASQSSSTVESPPD